MRVPRTKSAVIQFCPPSATKVGKKIRVVEYSARRPEGLMLLIQTDERSSTQASFIMDITASCSGRPEKEREGHS